MTILYVHINVIFSWRGDTDRAMSADSDSPLHDEGEGGQAEAGLGGAHHAWNGDLGLPLHHSGVCDSSILSSSWYGSESVTSHSNTQH